MVLLFFPLLGITQPLSNLKFKNITGTDSLKTDDFYIVPFSESVFANNKTLLQGIDYRFDYGTGWFYLYRDSLIGEPLLLIYRVFNFKKTTALTSNQVFFAPGHRATDTLREFNSQTPESIRENQQRLKVSGVLSRGLQVGSNQNATLNSDLNLQLNGNLTDDIKLEAVLTDKNIPLQPEGYSQQINEFDQMYIRVNDSTRFLQMGDVSIKSSNSYFLKFNRKLLGADLLVKEQTINQKFRSEFQASAAVAKGNFHRMLFNGIEGSQGPYPLNGANNESYIVVLAGTEKIYLDGVLLGRGEQADYVINYNTGELTFNTNHMITGNSRIIAEFEYSDKNYNRFLLYSQLHMESEKWKAGISYFNESDAKNQQVNQQLTSSQKNILNLAGDNNLNAWAPNYDSVGFSNSLVLYKMVDTLVSGIGYDSILVFSTNPDSAFYNAGFTWVGNNMGNYVREISATNGKLFRWVAPIAQIPQGNYEPVQLLVAPQKQQILVATASYLPNPRFLFETEWSVSDKDKNTFSALDDSDNNGLAFKNQVTFKLPTRNSEFKWRISHEFTHSHFKAIERFREAEFERDWNLFSTFTSHTHFVQTNVFIPSVFGEKQQANFEWLQSGQEYGGFRGGLNSIFIGKRFTEQVAVSFLKSTGDIYNTKFYRHQAQIFKKIGPLKVGASHQFEDNRVTLPLSDSLQDESQRYSLAGITLQSDDSLKNQWLVGYKNRVDYLPLGSQLKKVSQADDVLMQVHLTKNPKNRLEADVTWRNFQLLDSELLTNSKGEQNLLAKIDHHWEVLKNGISVNSYYEIGTGVENKKEYSFIEVAPGQGVYCWVDTNGNGIAELDEFEISPFPEEANYLKVFILTKEYVKVYSVKWSENIKLEPQKWWNNTKGIKNVISRFSNNLNYHIQQKHTEPGVWERLSPIRELIPDTSLLSASAQFRNTLSFNRNQRIFGADLSVSKQFQKSLLANGADETKTNLLELKVRWNLTPELILINNLQHSYRTFASEYFTSKNYKIIGYSNSAMFQWQPNPRFRTSITYILKDKKNAGSDERVFWNECTPEIKFNTPGKGALTVNVSVIVNQFKGDENLSVAYQLLEGYAPGENYRWTVQWVRNLNQFLRASLNYQGRKPAGLPVIHTGQVSVSAYF